jgi:2-keto-myo-inositol isomerase
MKAEQLAIHSLSTSHRNLEEALDAYADAGFKNVEPYLPLVKAWMEDGHTMDQTWKLFHTDGPEQVTAGSLDPIARALMDLAEATEDLGVDIAVEFNASPVVRSLQTAVRVAQIADHLRVGVLFDTAHYHVTPTKLSDVNEGSVKWIKHVHLNDMPDIPADLAHRDFDRVLPGEGVLDLPEIISALERGGYEGYFAIELFNADLWALPAKETARRCYESLLQLCEG